MTKLKICGLSRPQDIGYVNEVMPDYIGFVFAKSPRQVSYSTAAMLRADLKKEIIPVGVFVNSPVEDIKTLYVSGIIEAAQLHGDENIEYIKKLKKICDVPVVKAIKLNKTTDISQFESGLIDYFLFDSGTGGGKTFDWDLIPSTKTPFFLAGGINTGNISKAIQITKPFAVDISSGVEENEVKNREKILNIERSVRNV